MASPAGHLDQGSRVAWLAPLLIAVQAPLALLAANRHEVSLADAGRSLTVCLFLGVAATVVGALAARGRAIGAVVAGVALLAFFSYGHLYSGLKMLGPLGVAVARHRYLLPAEAAVGLGLWFLLAKTPSLGPALARGLIGLGLYLFALPVWSLVAFEVRTRPVGDGRVEFEASLPGDRRDLPDIYYVVLDGYGRADILSELYNYDNQRFLEFLRSRGFYVADQALSNYSQTLLSLASSLNMEYLDEVARAEGPASTDRQPLADRIRDNRVFSQVRALGYSIVAFETGYGPTTLEGADVFLVPDYTSTSSPLSTYKGLRLNEFEGVLLETTMVRAVLDRYVHQLQRRVPGLIDFNYDKHRQRVLYAISSLSDVAARPGAHFVLAHIISPHPPFVFGPRGERVPHSRPFSLQDTGCCEQSEYLQRYPDQLEYINRLLEVEINEILRASEVPPVIILQGDHGPGGYLEWESPTDVGRLERMSILNALLLPAGGGDLYPTITPVNSFRVVFDRYFGSSLGTLDDVSYFSSTRRPYDWEPLAFPP